MSKSPESRLCPKCQGPMEPAAEICHRCGHDLLGGPLVRAFHKGHQRALDLFQSERFAESISEFKAAYKLRPEASILYKVGVAYHMMKSHRQALPFLEGYKRTQRKIDPRAAAKLADMIEVCRRQIEEEEVRQTRARQVAQQRRSSPPPQTGDDPWSRFEHESTGPAEDVQKVKDWKVHFDSSTAHAAAGRYAEAIRDLLEANTLRPDSAFLFRIAWFHRALGQHRQALDFFRRYEQAEPRLDPAARGRLDLLLAEARQAIAAMAPAEVMDLQAEWEVEEGTEKVGDIDERSPPS